MVSKMKKRLRLRFLGKKKTKIKRREINVNKAEQLTLSNIFSVLTEEKYY